MEQGCKLQFLTPNPWLWHCFSLDSQKRECERMLRWMWKHLTVELRNKSCSCPWLHSRCGGPATVVPTSVPWLLISSSFPEPLPRILTLLTKPLGKLTVCCFPLFGGCFLLQFFYLWIALGPKACLLPLALSVLSFRLQNSWNNLVWTLLFLPSDSQ